MVAFWCYVCNGEHDNARDCPEYDGGMERDARKIDKRIKRIDRDVKRRSNMRENNYMPIRPGQSAPKSGCLVIAVALAAVPVAAWYYFA